MNDCKFTWCKKSDSEIVSIEFLECIDGYVLWGKKHNNIKIPLLEIDSAGKVTVFEPLEMAATQQTDQNQQQQASGVSLLGGAANFISGEGII